LIAEAAPRTRTIHQKREVGKILRHRRIAHGQVFRKDESKVRRLIAPGDDPKLRVEHGRRGIINDYANGAGRRKKAATRGTETEPPFFAQSRRARLNREFKRPGRTLFHNSVAILVDGENI